jgi:predicted ATPase
MFDWNAHLRETAAHLLWMASIPGAAEHARHRRDALIADPMYAGLRDVLKELRDEARSQSRR